MKYLKNIVILLSFVFCLQNVNAQNILSNIKTISQEEFNQIQDPQAGDIFMIKDVGKILYFSGKQWFAMQGECFPKPVSPRIDNIVQSENVIQISFDDAKRKFQQYIIKENNSNKEYIVKNSPAVIAINELNGKLSFTVLGKNECGISGPVSVESIEIIKGE